MLCRNKISMLKDLKVSLLGRKCVYSKPEHNMQKQGERVGILKALKSENEIYQWVELKE